MAKRAGEDGGLAEEKATLRAAMRAARAGIPTAEREWLSAEACARVLALPEIQAAHTVAVYCARGSELALDTLVQGLRGRGSVRLVAPVTLTGRRLAFVLVDPAELLAHTDENSASPSTGGHPAFLAHPNQPASAVPAGRVVVAPEDIDVILVPGLAFDRRGMRLGYGAGYYDAWLDGTFDDATPKKHPLLVGICFDEQLVPRIPTEPHDQPIETVITPSNFFRYNLFK